jgi:hypothetical protein
MSNAPNPSSDPNPDPLPIIDDTPPPDSQPDPESTFNQLRIRQLTALRMGAIRSRSWWLIAFYTALLTTLNLLVRATLSLSLSLTHHLTITPILELTAAIALLVLARYARRKAAAFKREIDHSALTEPAEPPDFSPLSNGSDRWKNLENVR